MKIPVFTGSSVALVTPFKKDGNINFQELEHFIEYQIKSGTNALTICGTTGECATLSTSEQKEILKFAVEVTNQRIPIIAGTGSNNTAHAIEVSEYAEKIGANALLLVSPYYNKTNQQGLIHHYQEIANHVNIPSILYNVPSRTGINIDASTYYELSKNPKINGVKEASGNFSLIAETIALCGEDLHIWSGNDEQTVAMMSLGAKGVISVFANLCPDISKEITDLCFNNTFKSATELQTKYLKLINILFCDVNPIPIKTALNIIGKDVGDLRLPLYQLSEQKKSILFSVLKEYNFI